MCESLAAMKILLTMKGEEEGEGEEEEEGEGDVEGRVESGRERMAEVDEERDEGYDQDNDNQKVEESEVGESEIDDVAEGGLHPIYTDSSNRNKNNEVPSDILFESIDIGKLTHHNLRNEHVHVPVHVRACKKKEGIDEFKLKLESTQINDKNKNENEGGNENKNGVKCADRKADHTVILISRNKVKINATNNIIKDHFNPTIIHEKSLISLNNSIKFTECSFHLKACSESMIRLKALIEKDVLNLSLVVHEPEIWRR